MPNVIQDLNLIVVLEEIQEIQKKDAVDLVIEIIAVEIMINTVINAEMIMVIKETTIIEAEMIDEKMMIKSRKVEDL